MIKKVKIYMYMFFKVCLMVIMCFMAYYLLKESWRLAVVGIKPTVLQYLDWFGIDYIIFALITLLAIIFDNLWRNFTKE